MGEGILNKIVIQLFGASSITTVFVTHKFIMPNVPGVFFKISSFTVTHAPFVIVAFAVLMMIASVSLIKSNRVRHTTRKDEKPLLLLFYGIIIGLVTGFLGAGGVLLILALVLLMKLPMKEAVGTSLLIIAREIL